MPNIERIQEELRGAGLDGWLLYDFHNRDAIACRVLGLDFSKFTSRRWFYFIPARGQPVRLCSRVEPTKLAALPGHQRFYLSWRELHQALAEMLAGARRVAMQFSPSANIPYVSVVDGGTVDLVRTLGVEVVSSADLVQTFDALLDERAYRSHIEAGERVQRIKEEAFARISSELRAGRPITSYDVQQFILRRFGEENLTCMGENPIVGTNEQPADPHFEPTPGNARPIARGDTVLIDLWAKLDRPGAIFYDITWCGYVGPQAPSPRYVEIFRVAREGRDAALRFIRERLAAGQPLRGCEVDDVCRGVVEGAGYGAFFIHRTGHSIGENVHGNGVNIDNLETCDERLLVPGICFSIEPGIYLPGEMAVRTEINVFITSDGRAEVSGAMQQELVCIEA